jgi:protein ImuB
MIACAWFPNWPVQRLQRARPELKRPFALHKHGRIIAATNASLVGLPVREVAVHVEEQDLQADRAELESLARWCDQFSPTIGVEDEVLLMDTTGLPFNAEQVAKAIRRRGFAVRLAVAKTVGAAWALAHYDEPFPVEALRLEEGTLKVLETLGVCYVTELEALPRDQLAARFADVVRRLDQLSGALPEPITPFREPPEIVVAQDLEYPLEHREMIAAVCLEAATQIARELSRRQQGAVRLELALDESRSIIGLFRPSDSAKYLYELIALQLEQVKLAQPVTRISLSVLMTAPLRAQQRELFDDEHDRERQLGLFVDRIRCRSPALRAVLVADAQPEHAFRYELFTNSRKQPSPRLTHPPRPLLIEPRPIPVEVISGSGLPQQFRWRGKTYRATQTSGPERILTGWWRGGYIRRDYYRVETTDGCYWLFRARGRWFLHGVF